MSNFASFLKLSCLSVSVTVVFLGCTSTNSEATPPSAKVAPSTPYLHTDIAKHATTADCWIIIKDSVYDVTNFLSKHPGGVKRIATFCGADASKAFEGKHGGSEKITKYKENFKVGILTEAAVPGKK